MAQVAELHEKLAAMGRELAGPPPPTAADARAAGEVMERVERVEDDVSLLIGARDVTKTALAGAKFTCFTGTKVQIMTPEAFADADKRAAATGAEIRHVDERVGELFDKVEALAAEVLDAKPLREVDALQNALLMNAYIHIHVYARQSFFYMLQKCLSPSLCERWSRRCRQCLID